MNEDNKKRMEEFKNVLLLVGLITLAIAASFGCFNYATLANKAGDPDNIFSHTTASPSTRWARNFSRKKTRSKIWKSKSTKSFSS